MTRVFLSTAEYKAVDKDPWLETCTYRTVFNSRIPLLFTNTPAYYSHVCCVYHTAKKRNKCSLNYKHAIIDVTETFNSQHSSGTPYVAQNHIRCAWMR